NYPGIVILHDFYLSDLIDWISETAPVSQENFFRELYKTHGMTALSFERKKGRRATIRKYPCNAVVFQNAIGVIVHSQYAVTEAKKIYGNNIEQSMRVIPHLKAANNHKDRIAAREHLGISNNEFIICSFGIITERKCSQNILKAWQHSLFNNSSKARLVFVGENTQDAYGKRLKDEVEHSKNVTITGYASTETYNDYLAAADLAIQLRTESRGETSGTILDCLANDLPVVVNNHGTSSEIDDSIVYKIPEMINDSDLDYVLNQAYTNPSTFKSQAENGHQYLIENNRPFDIGRKFFEAIENFEKNYSKTKEIISSIADFVAPCNFDDDDIKRTADVLNYQVTKKRQRQILYDVTVLAESDAKTGIQRVVRSILTNLIKNPPPGFRIEPVRLDGHQFRYARLFASRTLDIPSWVYPDDPVEYDKGDIYLAIDWVPDRLHQAEDWLLDFRRNDGKVVIGVHDLLPFQLPEYFPDFMPNVTNNWFKTCLHVASQFVCVSRSTADDVILFGNALKDEKSSAINVDYFHLAADLDGSIPSMGIPDNADSILSQIKSRISFLMVGTIEPRKDHNQIVKGFTKLWEKGVDINLVIVGKLGWMMDDFAQYLKTHPEFGKHLFWIDNASDEFLDRIYSASAALIAASRGEGFGLPIIEAASKKKYIIARDIPVFREVAGKNASYFEGTKPEVIVDTIDNWIKNYKNKRLPDSNKIPYFTWKDATKKLIEIIFSDNHYQKI
ncbi:MAG: glycosyltransferase, partial [Zymomonas mobilis subsp. pomaceae]|uniref:glycosyltransferase n=1 Tax=Zymomonas mobilis TaxID=542 RepID=UPI0039EC7227